MPLGAVDAEKVYLQRSFKGVTTFIDAIPAPPNIQKSPAGSKKLTCLLLDPGLLVGAGVPLVPY